MICISMRVVPWILLLCLLIAPACAASPAIVMTPAEVQVGSGETATVTVMMDTLPQGLSGYEIAFGIDDPAVAGITLVTFPEWAQMTTTSTLPSDTLEVKVADLNNAVNADATNVTLCTLTLRGETAGSALLSIAASTVDDDEGGRYAPAYTPAEVIVGGGATTTVTLCPDQMTLVPGQTANLTLTMDTVPQGLSGYGMTVASDDPDVVVITGIAFPSWAGMSESGAVPAASIQLKAADLNDAVGAGDIDVTLCTLSLRSVAAGSASIEITQKQFDDDNGGRYAPSTEGCRVMVVAAAETSLGIEPAIADLAPGETTEVSLVMHAVPQGLSGYNVSVGIADMDIAEITAVTFPDWAQMQTSGALPGASVWMKAVDLSDVIQTSDTNVTLCTLTLRGREKGVTTCGITATKIDDDEGGRYAPATGTAAIRVGIEPPNSSFTADPLQGIAPLTVQFTDTSTGNPTAWHWTFGDNTTSTEQHSTHTYTAAGTYTVNLTVTNADGSATCSRESCISVLDPMHIGLGNAKAERGAVTEAYLTISNTTSFGAAGLSLIYDPAVVMVDSVSSVAGAMVASNIDNENGITHIGCVETVGQSGDVQICTVALKATGEPGDVSPLNVTVRELKDASGTKLDFAAVPVPGEFQVLYPDTPDSTRYIIGGDLYKGIQSGNTIYLGEEDLNLTALGDVQQLVHAGDPTIGIAVSDSTSFDPVSNADFVPGRYDAWGADGLIRGEPWVEIREPEATLDVVLNGTTDSVHNASVTRAADIAFTFENNLDGLYTSPAASFVTIEVTTPTGETVTRFGGLDLAEIPVNTSVIHLAGIDLTDTAAGTYTARALWPASSDFAGKGYDSNTVTFEIVDRPLRLEASTDTMIRSHPFTVTITGDNARQYILYVVDASLTVEEDYPLIGAGQTGVQTGDDVPLLEGAANFSRTRASVTTDSSGNRTVQFETSTLTADQTFTIRVVDGENSQNAAEVQVRVEKGQVTGAASCGSTTTIGDEITLSGINTDGVMTYLFLTGPGLPASGVNMVNLSKSVVSDDPSTFTAVAVEIDETWEYIWDTASVWGGTLQEGAYTVYAAPQPKALGDLGEVPYASVTIRLTSPVQPGNVSFVVDLTSGVAPLTVQFTDTSANNPTTWHWTFGDNTTSTEQHPTHTYAAPGNYTVSLTVNGGADTCTRPAYIKVTPLLYGDANEDGAVNQADTLRVLREVVGLSAKPGANSEQFVKTDVHANGAIEVGDALFIAQYNVGLRDAWFEIV